MKLNRLNSLITVAVLAIILPAATFGQNPATGSQVIAVPITEVSLNCKTIWFEQLIINDQQAFEKVFDKERPSFGCEDYKKLKIDFQKYTLIALTKFADCQARVGVRVTKNTEKKLYVVTVESEYGGCRGMTGHNRAFLLEKVPADYSVRFENLKD